MRRTTVAFLLSMLLLAALVLAGPVIGKSSTTESPLTLAGTTWHTVHIDGDASVFVPIDGLGKLKEVEYWRQGSDLIARDEAYDVTVRFAPGKMEEEGWFW